MIKQALGGGDKQNPNKQNPSQDPNNPNKNPQKPYGNPQKDPRDRK